MNLYEKILQRQEKVSLVGLGYVGMPIAVAFARKVDVIGFDVNEHKIALYQKGVDPTHEVGDDAIKETSVQFTSDPEMLKQAKFHIVAVPTPVKSDKTPDLYPVEAASTLLGRNLTKGSIVVYESTVYPGVTEDICVPILEKESGLKCGVDFKIGYSPERINPGDKVHTLQTIVKIVSGMDEETLDIVAKMYELVVDAGVYRAESIKVAEAAKIIENSQRDVNIAFVNELAMMFDKMGVNTHAALDAAASKWNFIKYNPGLVGGHCIGVDPYYLTYRAEQLGVTSKIIAASRAINDSMGAYVGEAIVKALIDADKKVKNARVAIFGFTFKEDCPDTRNTKIVDIVHKLNEYGIDPILVDPVGDPDEIQREYGLRLHPISEVKEMDAVVIAVSHDCYRQMGPEDFKRFYRPCDDGSRPVFVDVKGIYSPCDVRASGYEYWRL